MNYYGNGGGGNQMQMMSSVMMSCACASLLSVGAMYLGKDTLASFMGTEDDTTDDLDPTPQPTTEAPFAGGRMRIKNGGVTMVTDKGTCKNTGIFFQNAKENDRDVWNLIPVPGKDNVYYIQSENRLFRKACPGYVTANSLCNKVSMGKAGWSDRQYWEPVQTGDGVMLRNVACKNKRKADYLTSSGTTSSKKKNPAKLNARAGSMYTLESVQFN